MTRCLPTVLSVMAFVSCARAAPVSTEEYLFHMAPGSIIELRLSANQTIQGRLSEIRSREFDLLYLKPGELGKRTYRYDEVQSVRLIRSAPGGCPCDAVKNIVLATGVLMGIGLIVGLLNR